MEDETQVANSEVRCRKATEAGGGDPPDFDFIFVRLLHCGSGTGIASAHCRGLRLQ